jgi:hypothetical protein
MLNPEVSRRRRAECLAAGGNKCAGRTVARFERSVRIAAVSTRDELLFLQNSLICRYGQELNKLRRPY